VIELVRAGPERIADLEPLWAALGEHHAAVAPAAFGPAREHADSWARRRAFYEKALADPGAFAILALRDGRAVGYAVVTPSRPSYTWQLNTAATLETLAVLPAERGNGVGTALIERVREELRAAGVTRLALGVLATNEAAIRFYRRHGFEDAFLEMMARI
jgi:ribosomal protein S18 acetylase RimI-like enzyme